MKNALTKNLIACNFSIQSLYSYNQSLKTSTCLCMLVFLMCICTYLNYIILKMDKWIRNYYVFTYNQRFGKICQFMQVGIIEIGLFKRKCLHLAYLFLNIKSQVPEFWVLNQNGFKNTCNKNQEKTKFYKTIHNANLIFLGFGSQNYFIISSTNLI